MINYDDKNHEYRFNEDIVPSVTQIVGVMLPGMYDGIPKRILQRKAAYGDRVHELVENYALKGEVPEDFNYRSFEGISLKRYQDLQEEHDIKIASCENIVHYMLGDKALYAGTYDMLGTVNGEVAIIDIKTTAKLHLDALRVQLPLYKYAIEQMCPNLKITKAYVMWLPKKDLGRLVEVTFPEDDDLFLLDVHEACEKYLYGEDETF